jgi:hypothetical protein
MVVGTMGNEQKHEDRGLENKSETQKTRKTMKITIKKRRDFSEAVGRTWQRI